jgi:hypothetical protein
LKHELLVTVGWKNRLSPLKRQVIKGIITKSNAGEEYVKSRLSRSQFPASFTILSAKGAVQQWAILPQVSGPEGLYLSV